MPARDDAASESVPASRADHHALAVYPVVLLSPGFRRAMAQALRVVTDLLSTRRAAPETLPQGQRPHHMGVP